MKTLIAFLLFATAFTAGASIPPELVADLSSPDLTKRFNAQVALRRLAFDAGTPGAEPAAAATLSKELLGMATDPALPEDTRLSALEQLPFLANGSSVPGLAALLSDQTPAIREGARCALENNPDPAATTPLLEALEKSEQTTWTLGLMQALAARGDAAAIPALVSRLDSPDPAISRLAAQTLGSLGGKKSLDALTKFLGTCPPPLLATVQSAVVRAARSVEGSEKSIASLWPVAANAGIRCEVFEALALQDSSQAVQVVADVLAKQDTPGAAEILRLAILSGNPSLKDPVIAALPGLGDDARLAVHAALAEKSDSSQEEDLIALAAALDISKKPTAIELLGSVGTAKSLDFLTTEAARKHPKTLPSAALAINRLNIPGLDARLLEAARGAPGPDISQAMLQLAFRNPPGTEALLLDSLTPQTPAETRAAAVSALEFAGRHKSASRLLTLIAEAPADTDPKPLIGAFRRISSRLDAEVALWKEAFLPAYKSASPANRQFLLHTIPGLRCAESSATLVEWIQNDTAMRPAYIEQLVSWNDLRNGESLLAVASIPDLDTQTREQLFNAATRLFFRNVRGEPAHKAAFAKKVLAAAPEGPIQEAVQKAISDAKLSL